MNRYEKYKYINSMYYTYQEENIDVHFKTLKSNTIVYLIANVFGIILRYSAFSRI